MNSDILFERDMLYPTDSSFEPGCIHIQVYGPDKDTKIPVVIDAKTAHSPLKHIDSIIRLMQNDIFDRIFIDIKKNVDIYIKANDELSAESGGHKYIKVCFTGDKIETVGCDA